MSRFAIAMFCCCALALTSLDANAALPIQDALRPAGPQAEAVYRLWNVMLAVCTAVLVAVTVVMLLAVFRGRRAECSTPPAVEPSQRDEPGVRRAVTGAVALTVIALLALLGASVHTDRALASLSLENALHIELTGHQWWWEAAYDDAQPARVFWTANELHVPVGRSVLFTLRSADVIHSLWVPNLHGKKDLIPGQTSTFAFRADAPGVYRGQCAEFCGLQHAKMALLVIADPPEIFEQWADTQRRPASLPSDPQAVRGHDLFMQRTCAICHTIAGTRAGGRSGPDLTHVASRRTIASGVLDNTPGNRAAWILNPQDVKPGANMPAHRLAPDELQALLAYLETLR